MSFMQPEIFHGDYFSVETTIGTEIVPVDIVGCTSAYASDLANYLEGTPNDPEEDLSAKTGWLARMSAPGYLDCTDWTAHDSEEGAQAYLTEMYGDDE